MALLLILQAFWLRNSYEKAYYDLHGKIDILFRGAVMAVRDSAILQRIQMIPGDSTEHSGNNFFFTQRVDSAFLSSKKKKGVKFKSETPNVQIYISTTGKPDSIKALLQPFASRLEEGSLKGTRFVFRAEKDSLNVDSIKSLFVKNLREQGLALNFELKSAKIVPAFPLPSPSGSNFNRLVITEGHISGRELALEERQFSAFGNIIQSQWVRIPPFSRYAVQIQNVRPLIIKEITPQIFFSGVLTLVTSISFIFMFRNIRSQQRLMVQKNDFISNITHELKTPIATVSVALEALKNFKGIDNPQLTGEYLDIAQQELRRLSILTDKVLTTSLFDEQGLKIEYEKLDLGKTVDVVVNSLKLVFEKQNAAIEVIKKGDNFSLEGSEVHLTNVVHNLLDNALKYSPANPVITISLVNLGTKVSLSVADKGLGIPEAFHEKIFEKFFRMPTGDVHNIKGYGLGLSYVDGVVKSHRGTITVASQPGEGSVFTIILPKARS